MLKVKLKKSIARSYKTLILLGDFVVIMAFILFWEFLVRRKILDPLFVASPSDILKVGNFIFTERFTQNFIQTLTNCTFGVVIGVPFGFALGFVIGLIPNLRAALIPYLTVLQTTPKVILLPIFTILFGIGTICRSLFIALHTFLLACLTTAETIGYVKRILIDVAKVMGASELQIFREIAFPYLTPTFIAGVRMSVASSFVAALVCELTLGGGIGGLVSSYTLKFMPQYVYLIVIIYGLFCAAINLLLVSLERKAGFWR